jgi:hypothetical protein
MKKIIFLFAIITTIIGCNDSDKKAEGTVLTAEQKEKAGVDSANYTSIQWLDSTSLKLGKVKKGEVVEVAYHFRNTGDKQLVITDVTAGCGCTVPEKPEKPFAPGEEGVIKAKFDSKNQQSGVPHTKYVTVMSNTNPNTHQLSFTVEITD